MCTRLGHLCFSMPHAPFGWDCVVCCVRVETSSTCIRKMLTALKAVDNV